MHRTRRLIEVEWAHNRKILGEGIGVAVVDTGVSGHPDLISRGNRISGFKDIIHGKTTPYDDNGHGTHVSSWWHKM